MKGLVVFFIFLIACQDNTVHEIVLVKNKKVDTAVLSTLNQVEIDLLKAYLFMYGNECVDTTKTVKCKILSALGLQDECNTNNLKTLKSRFSKLPLLVYKFETCPALPIKKGIKNRFQELSISRKADAISISFKIIGFNQAQEKFWNIEQTHFYKVKNNLFIKTQPWK